MSMNALDAALQLLAKASTALERQANPSFEDVEEAMAAAKDALKVLKSAAVLLDEGIFAVATDPEAQPEWVK